MPINYVTRMWFIYTMECYLAIKRSKILSCGIAGMRFEITILSEKGALSDSRIGQFVQTESRSVLVGAAGSRRRHGNSRGGDKTIPELDGDDSYTAM